MANTTEIGNVTEGAVLAALMRTGKVVLVPFGLQADYDLVFEQDGAFHRVQCKTGKLLENGTIRFNTYTVKHLDGKYKNVTYGDRIQFYGVFCPQTQEVYLVPAKHVGDKTMGFLRVTATANGQVKGVMWAKEYLLG